MGFDPITGIWAANKAAEIVGSSVGFPIVELSQETMAAFFSTGEAFANAEESAVFRKAASDLLPVMVRGRIDNVASITAVGNAIGTNVGDTTYADYYFVTSQVSFIVRVEENVKIYNPGATATTEVTP